MSPHPPVALTIAGSDPSGGAGIQGDLKTFSALGAYGTAVLTSLTAQSTQGVTGVHVLPAFLDERPDAVPVVVLDPVMVSTAGSRLLAEDAVEPMRQLLPHVSLITPNLPEAAVLLDTDPAENLDTIRAQAAALREMGAARVLVKGGHLGGDAHAPTCGSTTRESSS